ncbi:hypothetical protein ABNB59_02150 [Paenibacillus larvae]|uniref:Uncharacterized protein n=3 Tax=Paenibacillus larvae TaxID=1464 RepID=V9WB48_9BACL|nr:hypothetical protein [Paenibacillus larvae]AHD06945.1 hypothetical protein ERIC2_c31950 [Paenibacillus larvae subsp. larvae DSM 25430]AQR76057.1 hypothetical protein BXP28_00065 [Paenibacillus larvae subsp. larvae]AVF23214.1 hypothetical protein ERICI_03449 [Paenibacillus larvae subsp. larvae]AVG13507.1 hypothetical protein ERICII_03191 [Paenibacillus larvae subsp. larvae DSM 25430]ETK26109.1 hypothetical protein ERIC1_2c03060 [Paenibacillus larvae subsp. larvae DSM 25719]
MKNKHLNKKWVFILLAAFFNILLALLIMNRQDFFSSSSNEKNVPGFAGKVEVVSSPDLPAGVTSDSDSSENKYEQYSLYTQWKLAKNYKDGNYLVEAYQEYEIYKDERGNIMKTVPTENFRYLRYYQNPDQ